MRWLKNLFKKQKIDPEEAARHLALGVALAQRGRFHEALAAYRGAQRHDPGYALAYLNEALALQDLYNKQSGSLDDGERDERLRDIDEALERALSLDEELLVGWRALGHVARRRGDYVRAEHAFQRVLDIAPEGFEHREEAARELKLIGGRAERQRVLDRAVELALDKHAELDAVRESLERVQPLLIYPETPDDAFWAAGVLLRRLDDLAGARDMFEACVERSPRHVQARRELATLCIQAGDIRTALTHSVEAYREDPSNAALVCNVGVCHLSLGEYAQAEEFLKMARGLAPNDPIVQRAWSALEDARD